MVVLVMTFAEDDDTRYKRIKKSPYVRIYVGAWQDEKLMLVSVEAEALYFRGIMWSKEHDRDGLVPLAILPFLCAKFPDRGSELTNELTDAGLWQHLDGGGVGIPFDKWDDYQITTKRTVLMRAKAKKRQADKRERDRAARNGDAA